MTNYLKESDNIYTNYEKHITNHEEQIIKSYILSEFKPLTDIQQLTKDIRYKTREVNDESILKIKIIMFQLRNILKYSLLPFDHKRLELKEKKERLEKLLISYPNLKEERDNFSFNIEYILNNPENSKRRKVLEIIQNSRKKEKVGIINRVYDSYSLEDSFLSEVPHCIPINTPQEFKNLTQTFDKIILSSSGGDFHYHGQYHSIPNTLFTGFFAKKIFLIFYPIEKEFKCELEELPKTTINIIPKTFQRKHFRTNSEKIENDNEDESIENEFLNDLRIHHLDKIQSTQISDSMIADENKVDARLVILADNATTFFSKDQKLHVVDEEKIIETKVIDEIPIGTHVVLRTSGSGDYLGEVAKKLMEQDGKLEINTTSLNWKSVLFKALKENKEILIEASLRRNGIEYKTKGFIWKWTTEEVIRPQKSETFMCLMNILNELGFDIPNAKRKWEEMSERETYRHKAGNQIRAALFENLEKIIKNRNTLADEFPISLPGLDAGKLSVFRITDKDDRDSRVPFKELGKVERVK